MSDKKDTNSWVHDSDFGMGGIDKFNSETGKSEIIRQPETDRPFTIEDYNKALADAQKKQEDIMSEETQQVKRADLINAQNKASEEQQTDTGEELPKNPGGIEIALAGFSKNEIEVVLTDGVLEIKSVNAITDKDPNDGLVHKGIAKRAFTRKFTLADDIEVKDAKLENGLLVIDLEQIVPEHKKPKTIKVK